MEVARPAYFGEVEELLGGTPCFEDEARYNLAWEDFSQIDPACLGMRSLIYTNALRLIAECRREDRNIARKKALKAGASGFDVQTWNDGWHVTKRKLAEVAAKHQEEVSTLRSRLILLNTAEELVAEGAGASQGLRPDQQTNVEALTEALLQPRVPVEVVNPVTQAEERHWMYGITDKAPTGFGKTAVMGVFAGAFARRGLQSLIVADSTDAVDQLCGTVGNNTFRRFSGVEEVGRYDGMDKTPAKITATTTDSFVKYFRDGRLPAGQRQDIIFIEEVHTATEPRVKNTLLHEWEGPIMGFGATPAYHFLKDATAILPRLVETEDTVTYIEDLGLLSDVQLFCFRVGSDKAWERVPALRSEQSAEDGALPLISEEDELNSAVIDFVLSQVADGRRGMVFCSRGDHSRHALLLAKALSKAVRAEAIGAFQSESENRRITDAYHKGEIDVLLSVQKNRAGFDGEVNFVAIASFIGSLLQLTQIIGRGTRRSERFARTVYAQFLLPSYYKKAAVPRLLWEGFGLDAVPQGAIIASRSAHRNSAKPRKPHSNELPAFTPRLNELLTKSVPKLISEMTVAAGQREVTIPKDYIPLDTLAENMQMEPFDLQQELDAAGYAWRAKRPVVEGRRTLVRYYEPNAATCHDAMPQRPVHVKSRTLARRLGMPLTTLNELADRLGIAGNPKGQSRGFSAEEEQMLLAADHAGVPQAQKGDIRVVDLARELGWADPYRIYKRLRRDGRTPRPMRNYEGKYLYPHVLAEDANWLRAAQGNLPAALPTDKNRRQLALQLGLSSAQIAQSLDEKDLALARPKRQPFTGKGGNRELLYWSEQDAAIVAERIRYRRSGLPPHRVTAATITGLVNLVFRTVQKKLADAPTKEFFLLPNSLGNSARILAYGWIEVWLLQKRYGRRPGAPVLDYFKLPMTRSEITDPERRAYARMIQLQFMTAHDMGNPADIANC